MDKCILRKILLITIACVLVTGVLWPWSAGALNQNYYNSETPIFGASKLTDHLKNSGFSPQYSIGNFKQVYSRNTRRIYWFGQTGLHDRPYDIHGHWITPSGELFHQDRAERNSDGYYSAKLKLPRRRSKVETGQWSFELRDGEGHLILREYFYIGTDSGNTTVDLDAIWTDPEYNIHEADAVIFDHIIDIDVDDDYVVTRTIHKRMKILTEKGARMSQLYEPYREAHESARITLMNTIKPNGEIVRIPQQLVGQVTEYHPEYTSSKAVVFAFPEVEVGSVLEYEITFKGNKPVSRDLFYHQFRFSESIPVANVRYTVTVPQSFGLRYLNVNHDYEPEIEVLDKSRENRIRWTIKNTPPLTFEKHMPPYREVGRSVVVSTTAHWGPVAKWWLQESRRKRILSDKMKEFVDQAVKDETHPQRKLARIFAAFRAKFTVLPEELGRVSYEPIPTDEVFRREAGNSRDLSHTLEVLLEYAGIEAFPTFVRTRPLGDLAPNVTGLGEFNHMILTVEFEPNAPQFLDPRATHFQKGTFKSDLFGAELMVVKGDVIDMITLPIPGPTVSGQTLDVDAVVHSDFSMTGTMTMEYFGTADGEIKARLNGMKNRDFQLFIQSLVTRIFPNGRFERCETFNQKKFTRNARLVITFSVPNVIQEKAGGYAIRMVGTPINVPEHVKPERVNPIYKPTYGFSKTSMFIQLPEGLRAANVPSRQTVDTDMVAYYTEFSAVDNSIRLDDSITDKRLEVGLDEYERYFGFFDAYRQGVQVDIPLELVP